MALVIARSRRFDRFEEPVLTEAELPAELHHRLVWLVAAALRHYLVQHHRLGGVDAAIEAAAGASLGRHDEGESLEAVALRLARRLDGAGRLDGDFLARTIESGLLPLFLAGVATRCGLDVCRSVGSARRSAGARAGAAGCAPRGSTGARPRASCSR